MISCFICATKIAQGGPESRAKFTEASDRDSLAKRWALSLAVWAARQRCGTHLRQVGGDVRARGEVVGAPGERGHGFPARA